MKQKPNKQIRSSFGPNPNRILRSRLGSGVVWSKFGDDPNTQYHVGGMFDPDQFPNDREGFVRSLFWLGYRMGTKYHANAAQTVGMVITKFTPTDAAQMAAEWACRVWDSFGDRSSTVRIITPHFYRTPNNGLSIERVVRPTFEDMRDSVRLAAKAEMDWSLFGIRAYRNPNNGNMGTISRKNRSGARRVLEMGVRESDGSVVDLAFGKRSPYPFPDREAEIRLDTEQELNAREFGIRWDGGSDFSRLYWNRIQTAIMSGRSERFGIHTAERRANKLFGPTTEHQPTRPVRVPLGDSAMTYLARIEAARQQIRDRFGNGPHAGLVRVLIGRETQTSTERLTAVHFANGRILTRSVVERVTPKLIPTRFGWNTYQFANKHRSYFVGADAWGGPVGYRTAGK